MDTPTLYTVSPGLTFIPVGKHPTGTLTGDFYLHGTYITHGAFHPTTNEVGPDPRKVDTSGVSYAA